MLDGTDEPYRINHLTWCEQELANEEEMQEGIIMKGLIHTIPSKIGANLISNDGYV